MSKKQKVSDKIQAKFNKPQFQIGDAVFFSWLGQKQYGYVKKTKQSTWGIQYTVESTEGVKYPCGIQIQGQKTHYNTGFIFLDDTRSIGDEELKRRIQSAKDAPRTAKVFVNPARTTHESSIRDTGSGTDDAKDSGQDKPTRKKRSVKSDVVSSSIGGDGQSDTKKRNVSKNTKLEAAIQKQKTFLDFTKPIQKD
jgi:hypothetical protein